ncbi:MAG: ABC transporter ATP-binding protein [Fidelibacterota bacterium]
MLISSFILTACSSAVVLLGPYLIKQIIDKVLPAKDIRLLGRYVIALVGSYSVAFLIWCLQTRFSVKASENIFCKLRVKLIDSIMHKPVKFFNEYASGDLVTRFANDLEYISTFFYENLIRSLAFGLFSSILIIVLLAWNWQLGILSLITIPLLLIYISKTHNPIAERSGFARRKLAEQNDSLLDILAGYKEIRFFKQEKRLLAPFKKTADNYTDAAIRANTFTEFTRIGIDILGMLISFLPFIIGGLLVCLGNNKITAGLLIAYYQILTILTGQVLFSFMGITKLAQVLPVLERIREITDYPVESETGEMGISDIPESSEIIFQNVGFAYPSGKNVFMDFNLTVKPAEKIAIMGTSGSGKSTLSLLLLRFLNPTSGRIFFGGKDIRDYALSFYLSFFSFMSQDTFLFKQSLVENISLGWYNVPMEYIQAIAKMVRMDKIIESLPDQYQSIVGQNGLSFSGGQKQRLALARALIRDPEILVLDEFTSALDRDVEQEILTDLLNVFQNQTIICITHSLTVAEKFDRIVRL